MLHDVTRRHPLDSCSATSFLGFGRGGAAGQLDSTARRLLCNVHSWLRSGRGSRTARKHRSWTLYVTFLVSVPRGTDRNVLTAMLDSLIGTFSEASVAEGERPGSTAPALGPDWDVLRGFGRGGGNDQARRHPLNGRVGRSPRLRSRRKERVHRRAPPWVVSLARDMLAALCAHDAWTSVLADRVPWRRVLLEW